MCKPSNFVLCCGKFKIMSLSSAVRILLLALTCVVGSPFFANRAFARAENESAVATNPTNPPITHFEFKPGPIDGQIAFVTAGLLEQIHYSKQPFDRSVSSKFLDRYLEALDPQHLHFLQSDVAQFEKYRTRLGDKTIRSRAEADTHPAGKTLTRLPALFQHRVRYDNEMIHTETF